MVTIERALRMSRVVSRIMILLIDGKFRDRHVLPEIQFVMNVMPRAGYVGFEHHEGRAG
jgi:hypothetical protein